MGIIQKSYLIFFGTFILLLYQLDQNSFRFAFDYNKNTA